MTYVIAESFGIVITVLKFVGLYHEQKPSVLKLTWTVALYFSASVTTALALVNIFVEENSNIIRRTQMVIFSIQAAFGCLKILLFLKNGARIKKCINFFGHARFAPKNSEERNLVNKCSYVCRRNVRTFEGVVVFVLICWSIKPFFEKGSLLALDVWLPYDLTYSTTGYLLTYFYVLAAFFYLGIIITIIEPLLTGLTYHAIVQLKILKYNLQNLAKHQLDDNKFTVTFQEVFAQLQKCIDHHNDIFDFVEEFEDCFSWCIFCQTAGTTIGLCYCCIGLTIISSANITAIIFFTCYIVMCSQLFLYCHYGTMLYEEHTELTDAIYLSSWYKYDTKTRKMLIIILERSKAPLTISAGKVVDLTLTSFVSALKSSYSLIAVLNNYK